MNRLYLRAIVWLNRKCKSASVRLTHWTGKSAVPLHPKHLTDAEPAAPWYLDRIPSGAIVADLGCGSGVHTLRAAERAAFAAGLDRDARHLRGATILKEQARSANSAFLLGSLGVALPFRDAAIDRALLLDVLEHHESRVALLREIRRVLRPGGELLLSIPNRDTSWKRRLRSAGLFWMTDPDHKVEYDPDGLAAELRAGGFAIEGELEPIVYDTPWAGLIDLTGGISLRLYGRLVRWKRDMARRHPRETTGWRLACARLEDEHRPGQ